jgi:hypothetical protein
MGKGVGLAPISLRPESARGTAFRCQYLLHPGWDQLVPSMKLPRRLTVSLSLAIAEAPTVLSRNVTYETTIFLHEPILVRT